MMWIPGLFGIMTVWTLLIPAALFFGAGCCSRLPPAAPWSRSVPRGYGGCAGGRFAKHRFRRAGRLSAMMPQTGQASLGLLMTLMGLLILLCWLPLASRVPHHEQPV